METQISIIFSTLLNSIIIQGIVPKIPWNTKIYTRKPSILPIILKQMVKEWVLIMQAALLLQ